MHDGQRERGSALVMVLMFSLVVTAVGTTMLLSANTEHLISANERDSERALSAASAGLGYGFYLFQTGVLSASTTAPGTLFTSEYDDPSSPVNLGLDEGSFDGTLQDLALEAGRGAMYRIRSTGKYARATRTMEMVFQIRADAFRYGILAFSDALLHNHRVVTSSAGASSFKAVGTMFANHTVNIGHHYTFQGTVVSAGNLNLNQATAVTGDVFGWNIALASSAPGATVSGSARRLAAVTRHPASDLTDPDLYDNRARAYDWFGTTPRSSPGSFGGTGTVAGTSDTVQIVDGDDFRYSIFHRNGTLNDSPNLNVIRAATPPLLDYAAMKQEADRFEPTFFATTGDLITYLANHREPADADGMVIISVGTEDEPEFLYVQDPFSLTLPLAGGAGADNLGAGIIAADAFHLNGGIYCAGSFTFNGPPFNPAVHPAGFKQLSIEALPYCVPAIVAYDEPASGVPADWLPSNTPVMNDTPGDGDPAINIVSPAAEDGPAHGSVWINGLMFAQDISHLHHDQNASETVYVRGAELALRVHNCHFLDIRYDPRIICTRFLVNQDGDVEVVSYRELR